MNVKTEPEAKTDMLVAWREKEKQALELLGIVGQLRFDRSIELILFRKNIYDARPSELLGYHEEALNYGQTKIDVDCTLDIARIISEIDALAPARIDIGKMAMEWKASMGNKNGLRDFVRLKLSDFIGRDKGSIESRDVVLYGFGRIGRLIARRVVELTGRGEQLRLRAIVIRPKMKDRAEELQKRLALFRQDSVHGLFSGTADCDAERSELIINGNRVHVIFAERPADADYAKFGIRNAILIDNTGVWRDESSLSQHLNEGIAKVILTAPGKDVPNIVYGVNHVDCPDEQHVLSAASCTTNAIVPIIRALDSRYGIEKGHVETIHAYTSDQNLLDNFHKKPRRGRGAAINMVLTTTGAAKAVAKVMPHLDGRLTGNAVRVPTPNVSLAIMHLNLMRETDRDALNNYLRETSLYGDLVEQIHYSESTEYVSAHAIGTTSTSVLDAPSTIVSNDGKSIVVYAWYDNEYGYSCQVVRLAKHIARVRRFVYY